MKYSILFILILSTPLYLYQPNKQYLFVTHIYCVYLTCFGVTFTIIGKNLCALCLKTEVVMQQLSMVTTLVTS